MKNTIQVSVPVPKGIHGDFKAACALSHVKIETAVIEALVAWTESKMPDLKINYRPVENIQTREG